MDGRQPREKREVYDSLRPMYQYPFENHQDPNNEGEWQLVEEKRGIIKENTYSMRESPIEECEEQPRQLLQQTEVKRGRSKNKKQQSQRLKRVAHSPHSTPSPTLQQTHLDFQQHQQDVFSLQQHQQQPPYNMNYPQQGVQFNEITTLGYGHHFDDQIMTYEQTYPNSNSNSNHQQPMYIATPSSSSSSSSSVSYSSPNNTFVSPPTNPTSSTSSRPHSQKLKVTLYLNDTKGKVSTRSTVFRPISSQRKTQTTKQNREEINQAILNYLGTKSSE